MSDTAGMVIEVLAEVLEADEDSLSRETRFEGLEDWDSMTALELLTGLETRLDVKLNLMNYNQLVTVGELIDLAESELAKQ